MSALARFIDRIWKKVIEISNNAEPNNNVIGIVGVIGPSLVYVVVRLFEPFEYEGLLVYVIAILIPLPLIFYRHVPIRLKRYYPAYLFFGSIYAMSFDSFFLFLKNHGGEVWYLCVLGSGMFLIIVIYDWLLITLMMAIAYGSAILLYVLTEGFVWPSRIRPAYIVLLLFCYLGGIFLNYRRQNIQQDKISLMRSLSGTIAHEMRNPLNAISLAMENIQVTLPARPKGHAFESAGYLLSRKDLLSIHNVILDSIETVKLGNRTIDSILSNLREGEVDKRYFRRHSIAEVVLKAIDTYSYRNPDDRNLIFTDIRDTFDFFGDSEQFTYMLFNLISNALYYSGKQGFRIDISTESTPVGNIVRVKDTGPGIPAIYRNQLFKLFFSHGKQGGSGLGLSFCKRVVESFSGTIACDSIEGRWTEFIITLPRYDSRSVSSIKEKILEGKTVLVVDDQADNRMQHARYLGDFNFSVDLAADGWECLDLASGKRYDMILMDIEMPKLSGDEAVRLLRSGFNMSPSMMLHYRDVPIVGITGLPRSEAVRRTLNVGMNEFLPKPLNRAVLMALFEKYFFNEKSTAKTEKQASLRGARIIVADDNLTARKILGTMLENEGCLVSQAQHGEQVLDLLERGDFDLVLMDMEMPVMSGTKAVGTIRGDKRFRRHIDIPVIAVTGNTDPETIREVINSGMNAHIGKPVFRQNLLTTLSFWLEYARNNAAQHAADADFQESSTGGRNRIVDNEDDEIDRQVISSLLDIGDKEMLLLLYEHFREDADRQMELLETAAVEGDLAAARQACHSLKGSASSIGAVRLSSMARQTEDRLRQGHWPEEPAWFERYRSFYEENCRSLRDYISRLQEGPGKSS